MIDHPYRAPAMAPRRSNAVPATVILVATGSMLVGSCHAILRGVEQNATPTDLPRRSARAEQNARAWALSAYGVDPWVRCQAGACDIVVGKAAPFTLQCATTPGGACRVGGGR